MTAVVPLKAHPSSYLLVADVSKRGIATGLASSETGLPTADCKVMRAATLATAATAVLKEISESISSYAQNQFNKKTKRQPELELLSTIEEIDQMAIRDWLHRGGFDPVSSFDTLWRFPTAPGSQ